ncbi:hypothetical protein X975_11895, partial [Stegodyphus mimosarum]
FLDCEVPSTDTFASRRTKSLFIFFSPYYAKINITYKKNQHGTIVNHNLIKT